MLGGGRAPCWTAATISNRVADRRTLNSRLAMV
jgi:hypothetical protein